MSTKDQTLSAALHGEALLAARRPELQPLIDHLREVAQGRDDIRTECAGIIAGSWFAGAARRGEDLIAAGLLMIAGHVDLDEFDRWGQDRLGAAAWRHGAVRPNWLATRSGADRPRWPSRSYTATSPSRPATRDANTLQFAKVSGLAGVPQAMRPTATTTATAMR